jgi:hypothetical protein
MPVTVMGITKENWQEYVALLKLEITCGEAPFIVSRYDPISDKQELLTTLKTSGFFRQKIKNVSKY